MLIPPTSCFKFLIVGAGRSGTSLLTALLDQHSQLQVGFEVGAVDCLRGRALVEQPERLFQQRTSAFVESCVAAAEASAASVWGNKITTEQLAGLNRHNLFNTPALDILDTFFNHSLQGLPVIYLLRDGRACVQSKLSRTGQSLEQACNSWRYAVQVHDFLQTRNATLFLRFEELVEQPERELSRILAFLGLAFEQTTLSDKGTMHPDMPAAYRRKGIDRSRAAAIDTEHPCVELMQAELERCNYL